MDFKSEAQNLRNWAKIHGISDEQYADCVNRVLNDGETPKSIFKCIKNIFKSITGILAVIVTLYLIISCHDPTQNYITRSIQDLIYPFMRFVRLHTLFLHEIFPHLHEWHEAECLVKNPFYQNPDLSCWPCENVNSVIDLTGFSNFSEAYYHNGTPFIVKDASDKQISLTTLRTLYTLNSDALLRGTTSFSTNIHGIDSPNDFFDVRNQHFDEHVENKFLFWRFGRVGAARVLRATFPRPYFIPNTTEVALERFIVSLTRNSDYITLPLTDFANVWLTQGYGISVVTLDASPPCRLSCKPVTVQLQPRETLFYNWQFWRARISTLNRAQISILYIGSFY